MCPSGPLDDTKGPERIREPPSSLCGNSLDTSSFESHAARANEVWSYKRSAARAGAPPPPAVTLQFAQAATLENGPAEMTSHLAFHPYEPFLCVVRTGRAGHEFFLNATT